MLRVVADVEMWWLTLDEEQAGELKLRQGREPRPGVGWSMLHEFMGMIQPLSSPYYCHAFHLVQLFPRF